MEINHLNKEISRILSDIAELGKHLWQKGWAERNAGNVSVNVSEFITDILQQELSETAGTFVELDRSYPRIADNYFLVTATGTRMRDLEKDPSQNILLIRLNNMGIGYQIFSFGGLAEQALPTSELPTHLAIHERLVKKGAIEKSILHTHPGELIAITQIHQFCDEIVLNQLLWGMHPETIMFLPDGAGFVPFMSPGSQEIAAATIAKFEQHKVVIWEKHGCLSIGRDVFEAFDLIDILSKSAQIYFRCKSAGHEPEGLPEEMIAILKEVGKKF